MNVFLFPFFILCKTYDIPVKQQKIYSKFGKYQSVFVLNRTACKDNSKEEHLCLCYTPLAKLLARQARPGTAQDGSGNKAENYSSISATNQHQ